MVLFFQEEAQPDKSIARFMANTHKLKLNIDCDIEIFP